MAVKIFKPFEELKPIETCPGNTTDAVFMQRYDELGRPYLQKVRDEDLVERIRSCADQVDIRSLIKRYIASGGDASILNTRKGFYADLENIPGSVPEMYDLMARAKYVFDGLPENVKEIYNYSAEEFFVDRGEKAKSIIMPVVQESEVKTDGTDSQ